MKTNNHAYRMLRYLVPMVIIVAVLLNGCGGTSSSDSSSSLGQEPVSSSESVQQPASSFPAPVSNSSQKEPKDVYKWIIEPSLSYDVMMPVPNENINNEKTIDFLDVSKGNIWGVNRFDGSVVFEPVKTDSNSPMFVCALNNGHIHDPPFPDATSNEKTANQKLTAAGLPYPVSGGHGSENYSLLQHPGTGKMVEMAHGDGSIDIKKGKEEKSDIPIPVITYYKGLPGLAEDFSNGRSDLVDFNYRGLARADGTVLLAPEYTNSNYRNGFYALEKGGKWAYYSTKTEQFITGFVYDLPWVSVWKGSEIGFFNEDLCPVVQKGEYGYIDTKGNIIIPLKFEGATHVLHGRAWVKQGGLWGQIEFVRNE